MPPEPCVPSCVTRRSAYVVVTGCYAQVGVEALRRIAGVRSDCRH